VLPRGGGVDNANWKFAIKSYGAVNVSYYSTAAWPQG
jgi:hypothetical protein